MRKNFTLERQVHSSSIGKELHLCDIDVMFWKETNTCVPYNYPAPKQQHLPPLFSDPIQWQNIDYLEYAASLYLLRFCFNVGQFCDSLRRSQSEKRVKLFSVLKSFNGH